MRTAVALCVVVVLAVGGWFLYPFGGAGRGSPVQPGGVRADSPLRVADLRTRPLRGRRVSVLGVVGVVRPEESLFAMVDGAEVDACRTVACAEFLLPVSWQGEMPAVGDLVTVTGRVEASPSGSMLVAREVKRR